MAQLKSTVVQGNLAVTDNVSIEGNVISPINVLDQNITVSYVNPDTGEIGAEYSRLSPQAIRIQRGSSHAQMTAVSNGVSILTQSGNVTIPGSGGMIALQSDINARVPAPTSSDKGKFLQVNDSGKAAWVSIASAESATF